jgi:hypothetical protein
MQNQPKCKKRFEPQFKKLDKKNLFEYASISFKVLYEIGVTVFFHPTPIFPKQFPTK